jgi:hypothetical protein
MLKELLDNYMSNKFHIERRKQIRLRLSSITEDDCPSCIATYSDMPRSGNISDSTYVTVARKESDVEKIDKMIADLEQEVRVVDSLIATLKHKDQVFIKMIIVNKKSLNDIMHDLKYSEYSAVQRCHSRIMNELKKEFKKSI